MPRFFVPTAQFSGTAEGSTVSIFGEDAHHISRSLRMAAGEKIDVCPSDGAERGKIEYSCVLDRFFEDHVEARIEHIRPSLAEPPYFARLFVGLSKGDKMETVIQKAVECGVGEIVPFVSSRCIARPGDGEAKKQQRRQKIAAEAAKQCGRGLIPLVREPISYAEMLREASSAALPLFFYEGESACILPEVLSAYVPAPGDSVALVVGAEGGFSPDEADAATAAGLRSVGLGARILRCETAPVFALSCLSYAYELTDGNQKK